LGLYTVQYHPHDASQIRVLRFATLHEPDEHVLVLAFQQSAVARLILSIQRGIGFFKKRYQQHVQLEHAAPAVPVQTLLFHFCRHPDLSINKRLLRRASITPGEHTGTDKGPPQSYDVASRPLTRVLETVRDHASLPRSVPPVPHRIRSEERRVGKECRSRWWPYE